MNKNEIILIVCLLSVIALIFFLCVSSYKFIKQQPKVVSKFKARKITWIKNSK